MGFDMAPVFAAQTSTAGTSGPPTTTSPETQTLQPAASTPLVCAALDDTHFSRQIHQAMFDHCLNADPQRSVVLGETKEEQLAFTDIVLGRKNSSCDLISPPQPHADIVVLDENLELQVHTTYYILHTTYYILHTAYCILHTTYYILHTAHYMLNTTYYLLHTVYYVLHTTYHILHTAHYILHTTC
jgi:hypothetical protein